MFDILYRYVRRVLMPLRWAALKARCSVSCSGLQVLFLIKVRSGVAYVNFVLISVLYSSSATLGGICLFVHCIFRI